MNSEQSDIQKKEANRSRRYIVFSIGGSWLGFKLSSVLDVEGFRPDLVTPHPLQASTVIGIFPHRGQMQTLYDARKIFGVGSDSPENDRVVATVSASVPGKWETEVGIVFDAMKEIVFLESAQEAVGIDNHHLAAHIERTLIWHDQVLTLFDLEGIVEDTITSDIGGGL